MKKEKSKGPQEAREITVSYAPGKMIFQIGDQKFYLSEEVANFLFGRNVQIQFEKTHGQDDDFGGLRSLENFVKIQRLMRKGLTYSMIGKILNHPEQKIKEFYNYEVRRPRVETYNINAIETEYQKQAAQEMDFVREAPRSKAINEIEPPELGERFVNLVQVKNLLKQNMGSGKIATYLGLDEKEFDRFMGKNKCFLDLLP